MGDSGDETVKPAATTVAAAAPAGAAAASATNKISVQIKKLQEANTKYKRLLQMAKERIQQQEEEIETVRQEKTALEEKVAAAAVRDNESYASNNANNKETTAASPAEENEEIRTIVRVCQRIKTNHWMHSSNNNIYNNGSNSHLNSNGGSSSLVPEEIWALFEIEVSPANDFMMNNELAVPRQVLEWKRFDTESELQDYIRRDTGEPLKLPPYSLSPEQSARIEEDAARKVTQITEEFRRFRVRAELARKQADAQIRDLQSNHVQSAARRIETGDGGGGGGSTNRTEAAGSSSSSSSASGQQQQQLERLKAELAAQEAHWKEAYELLLAENNALKSKGSEALLASQWRQRYENCSKEKADLEAKLNNALSKAEESEAAKFEAKYKDLKESFRLYRKKAKEIFEAQERGAVVSPAAVAKTGSTYASSSSSAYSDESSAEAKLSYLKNLMVNYLTTDQKLREHMEGAIATVLRFSPDEVERIEKKKAENDSWF